MSRADHRPVMFALILTAPFAGGPGVCRVRVDLVSASVPILWMWAGCSKRSPADQLLLRRSQDWRSKRCCRIRAKPCGRWRLSQCGGHQACNTILLLAGCSKIIPASCRSAEVRRRVATVHASASSPPLLPTSSCWWARWHLSARQDVRSGVHSENGGRWAHSHLTLYLYDTGFATSASEGRGD